MPLRDFELAGWRRRGGSSARACGVRAVRSEGRRAPPEPARRARLSAEVTAARGLPGASCLQPEIKISPEGARARASAPVTSVERRPGDLQQMIRLSIEVIRRAHAISRPRSLCVRVDQRALAVDRRWGLRSARILARRIQGVRIRRGRDDASDWTSQAIAIDGAWRGVQPHRRISGHARILAHRIGHARAPCTPRASARSADLRAHVGAASAIRAPTWPQPWRPRAHVGTALATSAPRWAKPWRRPRRRGRSFGDPRARAGRSLPPWRPPRPRAPRAPAPPRPRRRAGAAQARRSSRGARRKPAARGSRRQAAGEAPVSARTPRVMCA